MNVRMVEQYIDLTLGDCAAFAPELVLCGTIVAMLIGRLFLPHTFHMGYVAASGIVIAIKLTSGQWNAAVANITNPSSAEIFGGMLVVDQFTLYFRAFLLLFTFLIVILSMLTGIPDEEDSADFYTLLLGAVLGMSMMASANHLLMVFLAVEMASVPSYAMAGFLKGRRPSSEAALKYVVYGGASAGVMLYGISLLAGLFGTAHVPTMAQAMLAKVAAEGNSFDMTTMLALSLVLVGLAFKLSAFPFHFWCPDVFEGAAAEVAAFLSVASKGAAVALLARFSMTLTGQFHDASALARNWAPAAAAMAAYFGPCLAIIGAVTATFGNLAAYSQTNLKRLLAYSTIAHAGYMIMALAPLTELGVKAATFYLFAYFFMNLGAFAVVAFVRNQTGGDDFRAVSGLIQRAPFLTVAMCLFLLSLLGIPPMVGFVAKFQIFWALYSGGWYTLLGVMAVNTLISLVYYINVMRVMVMQEPDGESRTPEAAASRLFVAIPAGCVIAFGILWSVPDAFAQFGSASLRSAPAVIATANDSKLAANDAVRPNGGVAARD